MEARRIIAVLLFATANTTINTSTLAQQSPEESLDLTIHHGRVVAVQSGRTFTVNPEFETLDQPWDERFGGAFEIPEHFAFDMAYMAGYQRDSEETVEEFLTELEETGRRLVLSAETPHIDEKAWLLLENASSVNPKQGIIFDAPNRGRLALNLFVEGNNKYNIQFILESLGPGIFEIVIGTDQQQYKDATGKRKNIFVSIRALTSGWIRIELNRTFGVGFILRSVDVIATEMQ